MVAGLPLGLILARAGETGPGPWPSATPELGEKTTPRDARVAVTRDALPSPSPVPGSHGSRREVGGAGPGRVSAALGGARARGSPGATYLTPVATHPAPSCDSEPAGGEPWGREPEPPWLAPLGLGGNFPESQHGRHVCADDSGRYGSPPGSSRVARVLPGPAS